MSQPILRTPMKKAYPIPIPEFDDSPSPSSQKLPSRFNISPRNQSIIPILPSFGNLPRISGDTLVDIISGQYSDRMNDYFIVDCRFHYEYEGGHIKDAINCCDPAILNQLFFEEVKDNVVIIFHCEFSQNRGPQMAQFFREKDREMNCQRYPDLFYPNVFILNGGYNLFFSQFEGYCDGGYVSMFDEQHKLNGDLIKATNDFRQNVGRIETQSSLPFLAKYTTYDDLKSPGKFSKDDQFQSPMASKMLRFLASPSPARCHTYPPES